MKTNITVLIIVFGMVMTLVDYREYVMSHK